MTNNHEKQDALAEAEAEERRHWHLDKRVPLALILTIVFQTVGLVWWASQLSERVNSLERVAEARAPQGDRLTRVEVKIESIQTGVDEIKQMIIRRSN